MSRWNKESILDFVNSHDWYHKIQLTDEVETPGRGYEQIWDNARKVRSSIDYKGKSVLDIGSWDGMWAFEAEKLGAEKVVATDLHGDDVLLKFLTCREILGSNCLPFYNVSPYNLVDGLMPYFHTFKGVKSFPNRNAYVKTRLFDIVQHFGVLYHLRDPLFALSQARSVLKTGGIIIVETAVSTDDESPRMLFNCNAQKEKAVYDDITTWWSQSAMCLEEMLRASLFEPIPGAKSIIPSSAKVSRIAIAARAVGRQEAAADLVSELEREYRNPGLVSELID